MINDLTGMTVSELNLLIAEAIRKEPGTRSVTVHGEISGFKHHLASGHWYFSLKDTSASINCVMFRQNNIRTSTKPEDGMHVVITGYVDVYPKTGICQLYVWSVRRDGIGDFYAQFEALKRKLYREGLLDPSRKKNLPMIPRKTAVITSESGAALHDILNVSAKRCPSLPIVLIPVSVQGQNAGMEIAEGFRKAFQIPDVDVIILARGGGSAEDLWCFNDEVLARIIASSPVPVVTGIGHEIDDTICDYVADVRASTPSNAAEIVFPEKKELLQRLDLLRNTLAGSAESRVKQLQLAVLRMKESMMQHQPEKRLLLLRNTSRAYRLRLIQEMDRQLGRKTVQVQKNGLMLTNAVTRRADHARSVLMQTFAQLQAISPQNTLKRGYAMVCTPKGQILSSAEKAEKVHEMILHFADGKVKVYRGDE